MSKAKFIQENGETILPITHEEAVLDNDGKNLPSKYQQKQDENLLTDAKTIVGAINELSTKGGGDGTITSVPYTEGSDLDIEQIGGGSNSEGTVKKLDNFFALSGTQFTLDANDILNIKGIYRTTLETLNLPSVCYDNTSSSSSYGILITLTQYSGSSWGIQFYCPIDGDYRGATFNRILWGSNDDSLEAEDWSLPNANYIESSSGKTLSELFDIYDSWIGDVGNVAYANQDKIGETELATNDKTLTGAINELFQNVDSGKQLIADAIDEESITKDSTFQAMSDKIAEIKNNSGGLDIISATELPATGKENQICCLSDNPVSNFIVTSNSSDITSDTSTAYLVLGHSDDAVVLPINNGNITSNYSFQYVSQGTSNIFSYYYKNSTWNILTSPFYPIIINGASPSNAITTMATDEWYNGFSGTTFVMSGISSPNYIRCSSNDKIDWGLFSKLEITCKSTISEGNFIIGCTNSPSVSNYSSDGAGMFFYNGQYYTRYCNTTKATITLDISSLKGSYYLGLMWEPSNSNNMLEIYDIKFYK